jgi:hypothetical protein
MQLSFIFVALYAAVTGGTMMTYLLVLAPVFGLSALLVTTGTTMQSADFHLLSTCEGIVLCMALKLAGNKDPTFLTV